MNRKEFFDVISEIERRGDMVRENAYRFFQYRPGATITIGEVTIRCFWGEPVKAMVCRRGVRVDNGPGLDSETTIFRFPDGAERKFTQSAGSPQHNFNWLFRVGEGEIPPCPKVPMAKPGVTSGQVSMHITAHGHSERTSEWAEVTVQFVEHEYSFSDKAMALAEKGDIEGLKGLMDVQWSITPGAYDAFFLACPWLKAFALIRRDSVVKQQHQAHLASLLPCAP